MENTSSKNKLSHKKYIAFFDLDGTIISVNSGKIMINAAYKKGLMTTPEFIKGIWLSLLYKLKLKDTIKIIDSMVSWLRGVNKTEFADFSKQVFEDHIKAHIRHEIIEEVSFHKKEGARVVILSSALNAVCIPVSEYLEMDDIICSNLGEDNGIYSGHTSGPLCFGKEKVNRLTEYCLEHDAKTNESWYYGDSIADLPGLSAVGYPVCVKPGKRLLIEARKRNWKVII